MWPFALLLGDRFVAAASAAECGDVVGVVLSVAVVTPLPTADVMGEPVALATGYAVAVPAPGDSELGGVVLDDKRRTMATLTALLAAGSVVAI